jgi:hypothetical protein
MVTKLGDYMLLLGKATDFDWSSFLCHFFLEIEETYCFSHLFSRNSKALPPGRRVTSAYSIPIGCVDRMTCTYQKDY